MTASPSPESIEFLKHWSAHSRGVYAYIYSLVANWSDADDIFQETSLVLMQKFHEFQPGTNFFAWACRIAYHKVLVHFKGRRFHEHIDERLLDVVRAEALPLAEHFNTRIAALADCLSQLPDKDRKLIELRYHGESSVERVAQQIDRTAWAVYKALTRIHDALLDCIRRKLTEGERG